MRGDLSRLDIAVEAYSHANGGKFPASLLQLVVPDANGGTFFNGSRIPKDPWGNDYLYDPPRAEGDLPMVYSFGKDGERGGRGDDADVDSLSLREDR